MYKCQSLKITLCSKLRWHNVFFLSRMSRNARLPALFGTFYLNLPVHLLQRTRRPCLEPKYLSNFPQAFYFGEGGWTVRGFLRISYAEIRGEREREKEKTKSNQSATPSKIIWIETKWKAYFGKLHLLILPTVKLGMQVLNSSIRNGNLKILTKKCATRSRH